MSKPKTSPNQESEPNQTTTNNEELTSKNITVYFNIGVEIEIPPQQVADLTDNSDLIAYANDEAIEEVKKWSLSQFLEAVNESGATYYDNDGEELT